MDTALAPPHRPSVREAHALMLCVGQWPFVRVDMAGVGATVHTGVRDTTIARLDLLTGALTTFVGADVARSLVAADPQVRLSPQGVRVDVVDERSRRAAERLIRWRIDLERFGPQLRDASP